MTTLNLTVTSEANDGTDAAGGWDSRTGSGAGEYFTFRMASASTPDEYGVTRFVSVTIPQGSTINSATLGFDVVTGGIGLAANSQVTINGETADNSAAISAGHRPLNGWGGNTTASTDITGLNSTGRKTASITAVIQEIISRAGWVSGNALSLRWTPSGADTYFQSRIADTGATGGLLPVSLDIDYGASSSTAGRNRMLMGFG